MKIEQPAKQQRNGVIVPKSVKWMEAVDAFLGTPPEGHLDSGVLVDVASGKLGGDELQEAQAHLDSCDDCRQLVAMAKEGLDEADRIERGLK